MCWSCIAGAVLVVAEGDVLVASGKLLSIFDAFVPQLTYGRTVAKAMDTFDLDPARWPELAANRSAWRETLRTGVAPPAFWPPAPPPQAKPLSRTKLPRSSAQQTQAKMNESLRRERLT